jgi:hypothetical protein
MEHKKQNVSVRMNTSDLRRIKEVAKRLHAKESDVLRYAIKTTLTKLAPLYESQLRGTDLIPVLLETGRDLGNHFDLDSTVLERIVNDGVEDAGKRVERRDIELLAMVLVNETYRYITLSEFGNKNINHEQALAMLLEYFTEKYVNRGTLMQVRSKTTGAAAVG